MPQEGLNPEQSPSPLTSHRHNDTDLNPFLQMEPGCMRGFTNPKLLGPRQQTNKENGPGASGGQ